MSRYFTVEFDFFVEKQLWDKLNSKEKDYYENTFLIRLVDRVEEDYKGFDDGEWKWEFSDRQDGHHSTLTGLLSSDENVYKNHIKSLIDKSYLDFIEILIERFNVNIEYDHEINITVEELENFNPSDY